MEPDTEVEEGLNPPWWKKYADKYQGSTSFEMGETTPPPEEHVDEFPKAYSMNSETEPIPEPAPAVPEPEPEKPQEPEPVLPEPEIPEEPEPEPKCPFCYKDFSGKDELQEHMKEVHNVVIKPKPKVEKKIETSQNGIENVTETGTGTGTHTGTGTKQTMAEPEPEIISIPTTPTTEEKFSAELIPEPENPKEPEPVPSLTEKSKRSLSNLTEKLMGKSKVKKMKTKKMAAANKNKSDPTNIVQDQNNEDDEEKENISNEKSRQINSNSNRKRPLEDREIEGQQFRIIFIISLFSFIFILFFLCCFLPFFGFFC